jgi:endonuclease YncB( thermonuclease family)
MNKYKSIIFVMAVCFVGCLDARTIIPIPQDNILYIFDGDTFFVMCQSGYICNNNKLSIRVVGVDTPEIKSSCEQEKKLARAAKQHTVAMLRNASTIELIINQNTPYDKYSRLLARVVVDGVYLDKSLIENNLGRKYYGKNKRASWCN